MKHIKLFENFTNDTTNTTIDNITPVYNPEPTNKNSQLNSTTSEFIQNTANYINDNFNKIRSIWKTEEISIIDKSLELKKLTKEFLDKKFNYSGSSGSSGSGFIFDLPATFNSMVLLGLLI